jgi:hypothetical protein
MNKIYILVFVDLVHMGFNAKSVDVFPSDVAANAEMEKQYLEKCKEEGIENPMDKTDYNIGHQFTKNGYAYILDKYYWDIFEKEIGVL